MSPFGKQDRENENPAFPAGFFLGLAVNLPFMKMNFH